MKRYLFEPTISRWQWSVMTIGLGVAALMGFTPYGALAWLGIVVVGGAIEGVLS